MNVDLAEVFWQNTTRQLHLCLLFNLVEEVIHPLKVCSLVNFFSRRMLSQAQIIAFSGFKRFIYFLRFFQFRVAIWRHCCGSVQGKRFVFLVTYYKQTFRHIQNRIHR